MCCIINCHSCVCSQDLAQCINEVKRDNEIIKQITTFQMSIENLVRSIFFSFTDHSLLVGLVFPLRSHQHLSAPQTQSLALFGRPKIDGELKFCSSEKKSKQDRCALCSLLHLSLLLLLLLHSGLTLFVSALHQVRVPLR